MSIDCPWDCEFLRQAHQHEKPQPLDPKTLPNQDAQISEETLRENEEFLTFLAGALVEAARSNRAVVDYDVREALEASIRTHRTLQSGLLYESLPANPLAAGLCQALEEAIGEYRRSEAERTGVHKTRESTVLGLLVFLQHFEISYNNGRRRGRAFLTALADYYSVPPPADAASPSSLVLP